jgi:anti-anti-sigma factor
MPTTAPPPLTLTTEDKGTTAIVHCQGKLLAGHTDLLYLPVSQLIPSHPRIILDLAGLTHMDSLGLGTLMRLYVSAKTKGCTIELRNLGKKVRELLIMTNLLPVFSAIGESNIRM